MIRKHRLSEKHRTQEMNLLLQLLNQSGRRVTEEEFNGVDWSDFTRLAIHHRVYPVLYPKIIQYVEWLPESVAENLKKEYTNNSIQMLGLSAETIRISKLLGEQQIRCLILKGPVLGLELYGDTSLRTSKDIDLLVPYEDLERTIQLLKEHGYVLEENEELAMSSRKWHEHHVSFINPQNNCQVEIHWKLNTGALSEPTFDDLWMNRRISKMNDSVMVLSEFDLFVYLSVHGARHGWFRLRWLLDINQLILGTENWELLETYYKKLRCLPIGGQSILLANYFFETKLSSRTIKFSTNKSAVKLAEMSLPFIEGIVNFTNLSHEMRMYYRSYLYKLYPYEKRFFYIFIQLLPNKRDLNTMKLPKPLYFLYYPLRPFLWFVRQIKAR